MARIGKVADQLGVLLGPVQQVLAGHDPICRARPAPVALEAGADEGFVREVRPAEQTRDPLEERGLGQRARGRQEAVDGPLDAVGQRDGGGLPVPLVGEPPAARGDLL